MTEALADPGFWGSSFSEEGSDCFYACFGGSGLVKGGALRWAQELLLLR